MELLGDSIKCKFCSEILVKPVLLPCGNSICKYHEEECRQKSVKTVYCVVCENDHEIPETNGFPRILALESLIEKKIENLDLGAEYRAAKNMYKDFSDLFVDYEKLKNDPEVVIHEKIGKLRNTVDLRREELKSRIDEDAMKIIAQLDEYEAKCKANLASIKEDNKLIEKMDGWKSDMSRWKQQLNTFNKDVQLWKNIHRDIRKRYSKIVPDYVDFKDRIFLSRFHDYSYLYLSVGNDYNMIKNHSLNFVVKNVSQYSNIGLDIDSNVVTAVGIDWSINVIISSDIHDEVQYVYIYLSYNNAACNPALKKEKVKVHCDYKIVNRVDPKKSIRKRSDRNADDYFNDDEENYEDMDEDENENADDYDDEDEDEKHKIIKYDDLINNPELYDAENDSFTAQIDIKKIIWL